MASGIKITRPAWTQDGSIEQQMTTIPRSALTAQAPSADSMREAMIKEMKESRRRPVPAVLNADEAVVNANTVQDLGGPQGVQQALNSNLPPDKQLQGMPTTAGGTLGLRAMAAGTIGGASQAIQERGQAMLGQSAGTVQTPYAYNTQFQRQQGRPASRAVATSTGKSVTIQPQAMPAPVIAPSISIPAPPTVTIQPQAMPAPVKAPSLSIPAPPPPPPGAANVTQMGQSMTALKPTVTIQPQAMPAMQKAPSISIPLPQPVATSNTTMADANSFIKTDDSGNPIPQIGGDYLNNQAKGTLGIKRKVKNYAAGTVDENKRTFFHDPDYVDTPWSQVASDVGNELGMDLMNVSNQLKNVKFKKLGSSVAPMDSVYSPKQIPITTKSNGTLGIKRMTVPNYANSTVGVTTTIAAPKPAAAVVAPTLTVAKPATVTIQPTATQTVASPTVNLPPGQIVQPAHAATTSTNVPTTVSTTGTPGIESPAAAMQRVLASEALQQQQSAQNQAAQQSMAQSGISGAAQQAATAQLNATQAGAAGTAASQMQANNASLYQQELENTLATAITNQDYTTADAVLAQLGQPQVNFSNTGDLAASNDMLQLATQYATTNPTLAAALTSQAMTLRGNVYQNIAGATFDPAVMSAAATGATAGNYDDPSVQALVGHVVPSILSWFDTAPGASSMYSVSSSTTTAPILAAIANGTDTPAQDQQLGYLMSLMYDNANGVPMSAADQTTLTNAGLWHDYTTPTTTTASTTGSTTTGTTGTTGTGGTNANAVTYTTGTPAAALATGGTPTPQNQAGGGTAFSNLADQQQAQNIFGNTSNDNLTALAQNIPGGGGQEFTDGVQQALGNMSGDTVNLGGQYYTIGDVEAHSPGTGDSRPSVSVTQVDGTGNTIGEGSLVLGADNVWKFVPLTSGTGAGQQTQSLNVMADGTTTVWGQPATTGEPLSDTDKAYVVSNWNSETPAQLAQSGSGDIRFFNGRYVDKNGNVLNGKNAADLAYDATQAPGYKAPAPGATKETGDFGETTGNAPGGSDDNTIANVAEAIMTMGTGPLLNATGIFGTKGGQTDTQDAANTATALATGGLSLIANAFGWSW